MHKVNYLPEEQGSTDTTTPSDEFDPITLRPGYRYHRVGQSILIPDSGNDSMIDDPPLTPTFTNSLTDRAPLLDLETPPASVQLNLPPPMKSPYRPINSSVRLEPGAFILPFQIELEFREAGKIDCCELLPTVYSILISPRNTYEYVLNTIDTFLKGSDDVWSWYRSKVSEVNEVSRIWRLETSALSFGLPPKAADIESKRTVIRKKNWLSVCHLLKQGGGREPMIVHVLFRTTYSWIAQSETSSGL